MYLIYRKHKLYRSLVVLWVQLLVFVALRPWMLLSHPFTKTFAYWLYLVWDVQDFYSIALFLFVSCTNRRDTVKEDKASLQYVSLLG